MLNKLKRWCHNSETVAWGYFKIASGASLLSIHYIASYINDLLANSDIKSAITAMNFPPYIGLGLAVIGFITLSLRLRPGSQDPVC